MARKPRYRDVELIMKVRVRTGVTIAEAKLELKTRVNQLCGYYNFLPNGREMLESDVRIKRITKRSPS